MIKSKSISILVSSSSSLVFMTRLSLQGVRMVIDTRQVIDLVRMIVRQHGFFVKLLGISFDEQLKFTIDPYSFDVRAKKAKFFSDFFVRINGRQYGNDTVYGKSAGDKSKPSYVFMPVFLCKAKIGS
jgi:hypothetical protein